MNSKPIATSSPKRPMSDRARILSTLAIASVFSIAVIVVAIATLTVKRAQEMAKAAVQSQNLVHDISGSVTNLFNTLDDALITMVHHLEYEIKRGEIDTARIVSILTFEKSKHPKALTIRVINGAGSVIQFYPWADSSKNYSGRPYFSYLKEHPNGGLFITKPLRSKISNDKIIVLARRYTLPDGSFGGVVIIPVAVTELQKLFQGLDVGSAGLLLMRHEDMGFTAGFSAALADSILPIGDPAVAPEVFAAAKSGVDMATFVAVTPFDQTKRVMSFKRIANAPYFVVAGIAEKDYLASWKKDRFHTALGVGLFLSILWILTAVILVIQIRRNRERRIADIKQSRIESALKEQEKEKETLRVLMDSVPGFGFVKDLNLNYVMANRTLCDLLNVPYDQIKGKTDFDLFPEDLANNYVANDREVMASGVAKLLEEITVDVAQNNRRFVMATRKLPWYDNDGNVCGIYGMAFDISELKAAEEELKRANERLLLATTAGGIGIWEYDCVSKTMQWDAQMFRLYGITPDQFDDAYEAWKMCVHPDDLKRGDEEAQLAMLGKKEYDTEFRVIWPDGSVHHIVARALVHRNEEGVATKLIGTNYDITDRKQKETELQTVALRLQLATESAEMGVWDWDVKNNTMIWDNRMLELYGLTPETFPGGIEAWMNGLHPEDREETVALCQAALRGEKEWDTEFRVVHPDGKILHIKARGLVLRDEDGTANRMLGVNLDITEQKQIEEDLRSREELIRLINNATLDQIYCYDRENRFTYANRKLCENLHRVPEEIVGKTYWELGFPEYLCREWDELHQQAYRDGSVVENVCTPMPDGSDQHYEVNLSVVKNDSDEIIGIAGVNRNITERKQAEKALQDALYELKKSQEVAKIGNWVWHIPESRVEWSDEMYNIFGIEKEQFTGDLPLIIQKSIHPDDRDAVERSNRDVVEYSNPKPLEYRIVRPNGEIRHVWAKAGEVEHDKAGKPVLLRGIVHDITERKNQEAELFSLSQRLILATESAKVGIWDWDIVANILVWDDRIIEMYGQTPEMFPGGFEAWKNGLHPEDRDSAIELCQATIRGEKEWDTEFRVVCPDGTIRFLKALGKVIRNAEGTAVRMIGVNFDITEQKRSEELSQKNQKLESLGLLAGGIAHDFNNLMGGIFGYIQLAQYGSTEKQVQEDLDQAVKGIERARGLTLQLLTFAKGGAPISEVAELFPYVEKTVRFALSGSSCSCEFHVEDELYCSKYDKNQIGQVIDNIVINAQQAMPSGGLLIISAVNVTLSSGEHPTVAEGRYVKISIADSGIGIATDLLTKIFDPFYTTKQMGQGLGLATSYSIVKRHGGSIEVESAVGVGTTFHIYLPASDPVVPAVQEELSIVPSGSGTVIIMDDEQLIRSTISRMLKGLGYSPLESSSGSEAIALFRSEISAGREVVALILDLTVPNGMGGTEAVAEIHTIDGTVPVIVASGYADDPVMKNPELYGFTASIAKPFVRHELGEVLANVIV